MDDWMDGRLRDALKKLPALIYLTGFRQHMATGTSLAVLLPPIGVAAPVIRKLIGPWHS